MNPTKKKKKNVDKYAIHLDTLLGTGSYGQVYSAQIRETGEPIAAKIMQQPTCRYYIIQLLNKGSMSKDSYKFLKN